MEPGQNASPICGLQFFGHVAIDGVIGMMAVTLKDCDDYALCSIKIEPKRGVTSERTAVKSHHFPSSRTGWSGASRLSNHSAAWARWPGPGHDETEFSQLHRETIYSGIISGLLLGNRAMTDGSMLRVWATIERGV